MKEFLWALEIFVGLLLVLVVLIQAGRRSELGAAFGGGPSQSIFGPMGPATILEKATYILIAIFMALSLLIAKIYSKAETGVKLREGPPVKEIPELPEL